MVVTIVGRIVVNMTMLATAHAQLLRAWLLACLLLQTEIVVAN
jgi:hypothetical protein